MADLATISGNPSIYTMLDVAYRRANLRIESYASLFYLAFIYGFSVNSTKCAFAFEVPGDHSPRESTRHCVYLLSSAFAVPGRGSGQGLSTFLDTRYKKSLK